MLVQRVIRLLLAGVAPEKILCITFTKAAAANMAERVFTTLGHWVTLDNAALDAAIRDAGVPNPTVKLRKVARELFARALETPGGLKVQTIHALCTRLLQQFPFEANVPARFAVLDDRDQTDMMERANLKVFLEASRAPDSVLGRALQTAMANAADVTFKDVVREACLSRDHFMAWTDRRRQRGGRGSADVGRAWREPERQHRRRRARDRRRPVSAAQRAGARSPPRSIPAASRSETGATDCAQRWPLTGSDAGRRISRRISHRLNARRAQAVLTKNFVDDNPSVGRLFEAEDLAPRAPDREAPRRDYPRPHRGAAAYRDRGGGKLPAREGRARAARL